MILGLRSRISQLQDKLIEQRKTNDSEQHAMRRTINQQRIELKDANDTNNAFDDQLSQLMDEQLAAKATIEKLRSQPPDPKNVRKIEKLISENEGLHAKIEQAYAAGAAALAANEQSHLAEQKELRKLRKAKNHFDLELCRRQQEINAQAAEIGVLRPMRDELASIQPTTVMRNATWAAEVASMEAAAEVEAAAAEEQRGIIATNATLYAKELWVEEKYANDLAAQLASVQAELAGVRAEMGAMQAALDESRAEGERLQGENGRLQHELVLAAGQLVEQRAMTDTMAQMHEEAATSASEAAAFSARVQEANGELQSENGGLKAKLTAAVEQLAEQRSLAEAMEKRHEASLAAAAAAATAAAADAAAAAAAALDAATAMKPTAVAAPATAEVSESLAHTAESEADAAIASAEAEPQWEKLVLMIDVNDADGSACLAFEIVEGPVVQKTSTTLLAAAPDATIPTLTTAESDAPTTSSAAAPAAEADAPNGISAEEAAPAAEVAPTANMSAPSPPLPPPPATKEAAMMMAAARLATATTKFQAATRGMLARKERDRKLATVSFSIDESGYVSLGSLLDLSGPADDVAVDVPTAAEPNDDAPIAAANDADADETSGWAAAKQRAQLRLLGVIVRLQAVARGMQARAERDHQLVSLSLDVDESGKVSLASMFGDLGVEEAQPAPEVVAKPTLWAGAKMRARAKLLTQAKLARANATPLATEGQQLMDGETLWGAAALSIEVASDGVASLIFEL